jgi:sec-independent protein translocase protein TatA
MGSFSLIHWIIVGIALLLLFGGNRFSAMMGDVAKGLKSFKAGMADDEEEQRVKSEQQLQQQGRIGGYERPIDVSAQPRAVDPVAPPVTPTPTPTDGPLR